MRNLALEAPRLELRGFVKRSVNKIRGFGGGAQFEKSSPGGAEAGIETFCKENC